MSNPRKLEWQRRVRRAFAAEKGFSSAADYACGGLREAVLARDHNACVRCGMTDAEHKVKWGRPITVDHRDRNRSNNTMRNLQTLCLSCHGRKDISPGLIKPKCPSKKSEIIALRSRGVTYQAIADQVGLSIAVVWKWLKRWETESI